MILHRIRITTMVLLAIAVAGIIALMIIPGGAPEPGFPPVTTVDNPFAPSHR